MKEQEKLAKSLTAESTELIPFLPYLLQDLWDLGSDPNVMAGLIKKSFKDPSGIKVLDLACGKGAVSVKIAAELGCNVKGIDIIPEFIEYASKKAGEYNVDDLCEFKIEDINKSVENETGYDVVVFGAAGDVLGKIPDTLDKLSYTIKDGGYILVDDAYVPEECHIDYYTKNQWCESLKNSGLVLESEIIADKKEIKRINKEQQYHIKKRADELAKKYPKKKELFMNYIKSQQEECDMIEGDMVCATFLIKKPDKKGGV